MYILCTSYHLSTLVFSSTETLNCIFMISVDNHCSLSNSLITDRVRSTAVRYCFHGCLSVNISGGGVTPILFDQGIGTSPARTGLGYPEELDLDRLCRGRFTAVRLSCLYLCIWHFVFCKPFTISSNRFNRSCLLPPPQKKEPKFRILYSLVNLTYLLTRTLDQLTSEHKCKQRKTCADCGIESSPEKEYFCSYTVQYSEKFPIYTQLIPLKIMPCRFFAASLRAKVMFSFLLCREAIP